MLEVAFLASHLLWFMTTPDMEILYDMVTISPGKAMGLEDFELKEGAPAHIVVLDNAPTILEALRYHAAPAHVISHGKLVDREKMEQIAGTRER